jgi:hypothetical protein
MATFVTTAVKTPNPTLEIMFVTKLRRDCIWTMISEMFIFLYQPKNQRLKYTKLILPGLLSSGPLLWEIFEESCSNKRMEKGS